MKRFVGYLISKTPRAKKVAPTITQPKQLKKTMKKIGEKYKYSSARSKEYVRRIDKVQKLKDKRKEGVKAGKDLKKMVDTKQAEKGGVRNRIYPKQVPDKRTKGTGKKGEFVVDKIERKGKAIGGPINEKVKKFLKEKPKKDNIKEKILPKKKKDRLEELRKELGLKKGGKAKFPDLTGDGKVTRADILKGRGVFRKGGSTTFKNLKKKGVISDKVKVKDFKKQFGGGKK